MIRILFKTVWHLLAIVGVVAAATAAWFWNAGIDARSEPGSVETAVARTARSALIPASARHRRNPEAATSETIRSGLEHWADHCATCHSNDGSGDTEVGRSLYPRGPDMRKPDTQNLTDGELFYIIENGIKLTGMPAWGTGTPEGERSTWHLVHFIRRLPTLSEAELADMEELNPRTGAEWRALEEERRFLSGDTPMPTIERAPHDHKGTSK